MKNKEEIPKEEMDKVIREFSEITGKHFVMLFKMLGLQTHIEVMLINDPTGEEFILSLKTVEKFKQDQNAYAKEFRASDKARIEELEKHLDVKHATNVELTVKIEALDKELAELKKAAIDVANEAMTTQELGFRYRDKCNTQEVEITALKSLLGRVKYTLLACATSIPPNLEQLKMIEKDVTEIDQLNK